MIGINERNSGYCFFIVSKIGDDCIIPVCDTFCHRLLEDDNYVMIMESIMSHYPWWNLDPELYA